MGGQPTIERTTEGGEQDADFPHEMAETTEGCEYLHKDEQKYPTHTAEDDICREAGCDEVARLAAVGFSYKHQHRRVERRTKVDETIDVGNGGGIQDEVQDSPYPKTYLLGNKGEDDTYCVYVEE